MKTLAEVVPYVDQEVSTLELGLNLVTALVDGDVIVYQAGFASDIRTYGITHPETGELFSFKYKKEAKDFCAKNKIPEDHIVKSIEAEPVEYCLHSVKKMIESITEAVGANAYVIALSGDKNFRDDLYTEYKANRDSEHKPTHYEAIRTYLLENHPVALSIGCEADDVLGSMQSNQSCICTIDKDLNMIPGLHYNWNKGELYEVSEEEANQFFFEQLLTGDAADNIPGIKGVGPATAKKILKNKKTNSDMFDAVLERYFQDTKYDWTEDEIVRNGHLLWIQRYQGSTWEEDLF